MPTPLRSAARLALIAVPLLVLAGCAVFRHDSPAQPEPEPVVTEAPVEVTPPPPAPPPPKPKPAPRPKAPPPVRDVVVLFQEGSDAYRDVAAKILEQLPSARYRAVLVALHVPDSPDLLAPLIALRPAAAIAVGREAVDFARAHLASTPLVFCQVFNYQELFESGRSSRKRVPLRAPPSRSKPKCRLRIATRCTSSNGSRRRSTASGCFPTTRS
jgi:hypothetical protein